MSKLTPEEIKQRGDKMQEEARISVLVQEQAETARKSLLAGIEKDILGVNITEKASKQCTQCHSKDGHKLDCHDDSNKNQTRTFTGNI